MTAITKPAPCHAPGNRSLRYMTARRAMLPLVEALAREPARFVIIKHDLDLSGYPPPTLSGMLVAGGFISV
ncbi:hypothetical protein [Cronobacter condimenti]|uniref:hypothetical protein n=1 Tax=Cronobacter condimenti TaxID=1163710 RepID=UPI00100EEFC2|nr:hypothetical protein [Cronobacter condimenti]